MPAEATRRLKVLIAQIDLLLDFGRPREALDRADPEAAMSARDPIVIKDELMLRLVATHKMDKERLPLNAISSGKSDGYHARSASKPMKRSGLNVKRPPMP